MSGGSYNYLAYARDLDDLLNKSHDLEKMVERLEGLSEKEFPGSSAAAHMTRQLILKLQLWQSHAAASAEVLGDVWKSVEWWDSCDWGPEDVKEALDKLTSPPKEAPSLWTGSSPQSD